jgi:hypothetical protein
MAHVKEAIATSPYRVEVWLNDGKFLVFVIHKGKFLCSAKDSGIGKPAFKEACQAAGQALARQKNLPRQNPIAA